MDPAQLQPGHRLDRYELLCPLAYGGMASVWLARFGGRKGFERLVVVKMILPQYSQDPRFQEMFLDEARIASRIEHQNVARILDVGEHEDNTFIVMEWVDGDSLSKVVRAAESKKQRIPTGVVLRICADAAAGLHAAHVLTDREGTPLGVVHRDVSPQNILISNAGSTVLIDFGVAKARDRVSQDTSAGQLKGKIRYMAPEQALGRSIDRRADVWALGAILYEIFAGEPPYDGPNEVATLHKLTSGAAPAPLPPHVPPPVRAVIERALAYDPEARFASALELHLALESCLQEIGEPTTAAAVASYTARLLAERKAARKRAVDTALGNAHARDAQRASVVPPAKDPPEDAAPPSLAPRTDPLPRSTGAIPPAVESERELASSPSGGPMGAMGLAESPSAASSATLGSAAMEYPPYESLPDDAARRRRYAAAAILGVSIAAGVVGSVLIIVTAVSRSNAKDTGSTNGAAPTSQMIASPEASDPTGTSAATATVDDVAPAPAADAADAADAAAPTLDEIDVAPSASASESASSAPNGNGTTTKTPAAKPSPAAAPRRTPWPAAAAPRPKPAPASTVTTGKPDRGF